MTSLYLFVTVYQTNPVFSTSYYSSSTKAVQHFCRTALLFRLYLNRLHTRDILLQPQEIRFIEMPRHGNVQHDFTELPSCRLRAISRTVIFLCSSQSYRRTRSPLPSVRPTASSVTCIFSRRSTPISRPQTAAPNRSFKYFPAYASPSRIKAIAQTTGTASPGRSVCRYRPLRACRIPSRKHGIPSGLRFLPET